MNDEKTILSAVNIRKEYVTERHLITGKIKTKMVAVKGISFVLKRGKTLGIVGESGSGKSTITEIVGGIQKPTFGRVFYENKDINKMNTKDYLNFRKNVQFIFQDPKGSMNPNYKIKKIIIEPLEIMNLKKSKEDIEKSVDDILCKVGLDVDIKNKYPSQISGGQCQRVAIARAIVVNPKVVICDEPVSALDVSIQAQILNLLKKIQREYNISYIFISHDIGVINYMSDEIIVMNKGNMIEMDIAEKILKNPSNEYTKSLISSAFLDDLMK